MGSDQADLVRDFLRNKGFGIKSDTRLPNDTGHQFRTNEGPIVNIYDKGTCVVQGKNADPRLKDEIAAVLGNGSSNQVVRNVFVVYGHDVTARNNLEAMLRRWKLEPLLLDQLPSEGQTLIEKLERYQQEASFAIVLATPDDEGYPANHEDEKAFRARQNVVLELGMMLAILGRARVAVLIKGAAEMERPSDIQGLIYIPFTDDVSDAAVPLAKEMNKQGLTIDLNRL